MFQSLKIFQIAENVNSTAARFQQKQDSTSNSFTVVNIDPLYK